MNNIIRWLTLMLFLGLLACEESVNPVAMESTQEATSGLAKGSLCYTVQFDVTAHRMTNTHFEGKVTGDLEGTIITDFDLTSVTFA